MIKDFKLNETNAILNFSVKFCDTEQELLQSEGFMRVLDSYLKNLSKKNTSLYDYFKGIEPKELNALIQQIFKLLIVFDLEEVISMDKRYEQILSDKGNFLEFIEGLYNYWRSFERYAVLQNRNRANGIQNVSFIDGINAFNNIILKVYRRITEMVLGKGQNVYRQLAAGVNAGIALNDIQWEIPEGYECLKNIAFIDQVILHPPFIVYSKKNVRKGTYKEINTNPLANIKLNTNHWFCYPAFVGESLAYVYFHRDYMSHGMGLCNLFKLASYEECEGKKPNLIYVFGARREEGTDDSNFFYDSKNDIYVGIANHTDEIDYFGYMKKMLLTLHNVRMIDQGSLPIHGAMVHVVMKDGRKANVVLVGDSGAGKSESLDALRSISGTYLKEMKVIFDDMGSFKLVNGKVVGYGTEVGAFVRLDDLEASYAYNEMDRSIFMNPNKVNSRVVIPITTYHAVTKGYPVDLLLYANNYTDTDKDINLFETKDEAITTFRKGARKAKGTTSEVGLVESYFANPFGPVQRQEQTEALLEKYFSTLYKQDIPVGEMYTKLAIQGFEYEGPRAAAVKLFEWIKKEGK